MDVGDLEPEEEKVCLRYILKYSTRRGSNIFQLYKREQGPSGGKQKALVGALRRGVAMQERWQIEWHDIEYQGAVAQARRAPTGP